MRILLMDNDTTTAAKTALELRRAGYQADIADSAEVGFALLREHNYHLLILETCLPERDGWSVCEELRRRSSTLPILMVSACHSVGEKVRGLDAGADDFLAKPFDFEELLARVRALLRRDRIHRVRVIRVGDLEIDTGAHRVYQAGVEVNLSPREYALLEALAANEGRVLTRETIQERVWMNEEAGYNVVTVYVQTLRKKLNDHSVKILHTIHGIGYMLLAPLRDSLDVETDSNDSPIHSYNREEGLPQAQASPLGVNGCRKNNKQC